MVYPTLTEAQMKRSQRYYIGFNLLNGIGYLCVGDMVMMLLANRLGFPDWVFTTLAALFNIGCVWLPLGKIATQYWGAARTQANFWFLRNFASVIMASCAIWGHFGHIYIAGAFLLGGAFIFYGCRSAGAVMSTALVGNITKPEDRGKLLAFASMSHHIVSTVAVVGLTFLLHWVKSMWALYGIVLFGAGCGALSAVCLRQIDESDAIMQAAKKPLIADAWACLKDSAFRRMVTAQVCFSLATALTIALNTLVLKRGFGVPDSWAMALSFVGGLLNVGLARPASLLGDKIGPRKAIIIAYGILFFVILFWQVVPATFHWYTWFVMMVMTSFCSMCNGICSGQYFLKCIPVEHQPSAATLQALINGVLTGFIAMGLTALLWMVCDWRLGPEITMERYRFFFILAIPFVLLGFIGVWRQKEV